MTLFSKSTKHTVLLFISLVFIGLFSAQHVVRAPQKKQVQASRKKMAMQSDTVRVLLKSMPIHTEYRLTLISPFGFSIKTGENALVQKSELSEVIIEGMQGILMIDNKRIKRERALIVPKQNMFVFQGRTYCGTCELLMHNKKLLIINNVPMEEYVSSVLRTESWPGWPVEVNKVFAIASRSYVLAMMQRSQKSNLPYHIKNTNEHQTYKGTHDCDVIKQAVQETKGMYLSYKSSPIIAMFDCCCGGIIPADLEGITFTDAPYLARTYACRHCKGCKIYSWKTVITKEQLDKAIKTKFKEIHSIQNIAVARKDKAGVVRELAITGPKMKQHIIPAQELAWLFKDIKSLCFSIVKSHDTFIFEGRGYGHHVGICQWGVREMVKDGWSYRKILQFYYPGVAILYTP